MPNESLVSIIITSYNYEKFIVKTVESVLSQTHDNWELIITDDASTDNSLQIIRAFQDSRITVITAEKHQGACAGYNRAYALCKGKYITSIDSDDYIDPTKLEKQLKIMESSPEIDICGTFVSEIDDEGFACCGKHAAWFNAEVDLNDPVTWIRGNRLCHSSVLLKKETHDRVGEFNNDLIYTPDFDFWIRCLSKGAKFHVLPEKLTYYRSHGQNVTHKNPVRSYFEVAFSHIRILHPYLRTIGRDDLITTSFDTMKYFLAFQQDPDTVRRKRELLEALTERFSKVSRFDQFWRDYGIDEKQKSLPLMLVIEEFRNEISGQLQNGEGLRNEISKQAQAIERLKRELSLQRESIKRMREERAVRDKRIAEQNFHIEKLREELVRANDSIENLRRQVNSKEISLEQIKQEMSSYKQTNPHKLQSALQEPLSPGKFGKVLYLAGAILTPDTIKSPLAKAGKTIRTSFDRKHNAEPAFEPYVVRPIHQPSPNRRRIVHAIGNFLTGGSSRLVVDLIEHMGHLYEQEVITAFNPEPLNYIGIPVHVFYPLSSPDPVRDYLERFRPDLLHVHYWGYQDKPWYENIFSAAERFGCKVIENINTPVNPLLSDHIDRYVYVSNYVHGVFGQEDGKSSVIYPGSNFQLFRRDDLHNVPDDCIGMVYRMEHDKLEEQSIDVFINVAKRRPKTRILIVGGGPFVKLYKHMARKEGVINSFSFTGLVSYGMLPSLYGKMSIFVAPVRRESFGQVGPFAMSMGIPVVGYDVGAIPEIIGDQSLLAPLRDSGRLADIIIELLEDRERRISIGEANRKRAHELFSVEAMIAGYGHLYKSLVEVKS